MPRASKSAITISSTISWTSESGDVGLLAPTKARNLPRLRDDQAGLQHLESRQGCRLRRHRRQGRTRRQGSPATRQCRHSRSTLAILKRFKGRRQRSRCRPGNAVCPSPTTRISAKAIRSSASRSRQSQDPFNRSCKLFRAGVSRAALPHGGAWPLGSLSRSICSIRNEEAARGPIPRRKKNDKKVHVLRRQGAIAAHAAYWRTHQA